MQLAEIEDADEMNRNIEDADEISRMIIYPKDYLAGGMLKLDMGFEFPSDAGRCESVNCHRLLNDDQSLIHGLGYQKQASDRSKGKDSTYMGYKAAVTGNIRAIQVDDYHFKVFHVHDNDNDAHCHIQLDFTDKQKNRRSVALNKLYDCFGGVQNPA